VDTPAAARDEIARAQFFIGDAVDDAVVAAARSADDKAEADKTFAASPTARASGAPASRTHDAELLADEDRARRLAAAGAQFSVRWYRPTDGSRDARILREATGLGLDVALWSALPWGPDDDDSPGCVAERMSREMDPRGAIVAINITAPDHLCRVPGDTPPSLAASAGAGTAMRDWRSAEEVLAVVDEVLAQTQGAMGLDVISLSDLFNGKYVEA
jgi:hypothetical protein